MKHAWRDFTAFALPCMTLRTAASIALRPCTARDAAFEVSKFALPSRGAVHPCTFVNFGACFARRMGDGARRVRP